MPNMTSSLPEDTKKTVTEMHKKVDINQLMKKTYIKQLKPLSLRQKLSNWSKIVIIVEKGKVYSPHTTRFYRVNTNKYFEILFRSKVNII